jgi:putative endonuclease
MASITQRLYIGVTNNLDRRTFEHKQGLTKGFTSKYKMHRLVYFECFDDIRYAIHREKQLKGWRRQRKINLIESVNPQWRDLASDFS